MQQGLPQGSVLAPILFLLYINNLAVILPDTTTNALYADDVTILASNTSKDVAEQEAQETVDIVVAWSKEWKLNLNATKSKVSFFTTAKYESKHCPKITINGANIKMEPNPRLLGLYLDRELASTQRL